MARTVDRERLGAWLLKCNPAAWDLRGFLATGERRLTSWSVQPGYRSDLLELGNFSFRDFRRHDDDRRRSHHLCCFGIELLLGCIGHLRAQEVARHSRREEHGRAGRRCVGSSGGGRSSTLRR